MSMSSLREQWSIAFTIDGTAPSPCTRTSKVRMENPMPDSVSSFSASRCAALPSEVMSARRSGTSGISMCLLVS